MNLFLCKLVLVSSLADETPEGKSIIELARKKILQLPITFDLYKATLIKFTAETRCSGVNLHNGKQIRKGAFDAIRKIASGSRKYFPNRNGRKSKRNFIQWRNTTGGFGR